MTKNLRRKKILSPICIALCILLTAGLIPATAFAAGYGDKGYDTTYIASYTIDSNDLFVYAIANGGTVTRISGGDGDSVQQYKAIANDNWEFAYWSTYYVGPLTQHSNPTAALGYHYFSKPGDEDTVYNKTNPVIQVNEETWAAGDFYLQAIFKPKVTVNTNFDLSDITPSIRGNSPATSLDSVFISGTSGYVPYGAATEIALTGFSDEYSIESITVHDGAPRNDFTYEITPYTLNTTLYQLKIKFTTTRPTTVTINAKLKQQNVNFDANGGSGSMSDQTFDSGKAQTLTENAFTNVGYIFSGWNTKANGDGTSYSDKESVTFTPVNDGDVLTLYAQWSECTSHNWVDGVCNDCGTVCSHNYIYNGSDNVITETCTAGCSHNETATIKQDDSVPTVYNGSPIEALKVVYSDEWKGGTLDISYTDNINAGTVQGTIAKDSAVATGTFEITKAAAPVVTTPAVSEITYGKKLSDIAFEDPAWSWADGNAMPTVINSGYTAFYTPADTDNYDWALVDGWYGSLKKVVRTVPVTVTPKELTITWGNTEFIYDGNEKLPEAIVGGVITGDDIQLTFDGAETDANAEGESYTATITGIVGPDAANYKLPDNVATKFTILKAAQSTPDNVGKTDETISGNADGTITGVTSDMEYRKDGEMTYTPVKGDIIEGLAPGTYYVRYAGNNNHEPSPDITIVIEKSNESGADNSTNTGDHSIIWLWLILILISSGTALVVVRFNRKR